MIDARGIPAAECVCGSNVLRVSVSFDEYYEISGYFTEAECAGCGALVTAPTPLDLVEA